MLNFRDKRLESQSDTQMSDSGMNMLFMSLTLLVVSTHALDCGDGIIRGVNLGGWLMLEPWITPTIFEEVNVGANKNKVVDEYTYAQYVDKTFAKERLERHWNEFYQNEDLEKLSSVGITHLRIPFGYWLVDVSPDEPFPMPPQNDEEGQRFYLKRLIGWADQLGIKVLLDLHGAPGSQNGFDNSGRRGEIHWPEGNNVERTMVILEKVADLVKGWIDEGAFSTETLAGIELLNEPAGWMENIWQTCRDNFYPNGYHRLRNIVDLEHNVVIQQGFRSSSDFHGYMPPEQDFHNVELDMHIYQCFGPYWNQLAERPEGWNTHLDASCAYKNEVVGHTLWAFTGEFSLAVTDCQKYLNGGYAETYIPPDASEATCRFYNSDFSTFPTNYKEFLKNYFLAQIDGYETGATGIGWYFWTGKTENNCAPEWDFLYLVQNGIVPSNLCERPVYCQ